MVHSNQYNLLFLRIPKTASTSLSTWFVQNACVESDVWTGIKDSKIGMNNFPLSTADKFKKQYRKIHLTLNELVQNNVISMEQAQTNRVIGVVRNPYHRQLSLFFFKNKNFNKSPDAFKACYRNGCHEFDGNNKILQSDYFKLGDKFAPKADPWLYDQINERLQTLVDEKNIEVKYPLMNYKSHFRKRDMQELMREYYDEKTREAVYNYYREDFELIEKLQ